MADTFRKAYRPLTDAEVERLERIKDAAEVLNDELHSGPQANTREMNIAKTNLEQCVMWAVKAVTG